MVNWLHDIPHFSFCFIEGQAKVNKFNLKVAPANKHDVVRLDISVKDANVGEGIQCTEQLQPKRTTLVSD